LIRIREDLRDYLLRTCPLRTDEALMHRFGISYNTLRKIESGAAVRRSLAERLELLLESEIRSAPLEEARRQNAR
jgi:hypothetical protein